MKKTSWIAAGLLNLSLLGITVLLWTRELPKPQTYAVVIPEGATVFPADQVHAGTFKIDVPIEKLVAYGAKVGKEVLVSYGCDENRDVLVEYWVSRGDSTFLYASRVINSGWPIGITTDKIETTSSGLRLIPGHGDVYIGLLSALTAICMVVTGLVAWEGRQS